MKNFKTKNPQIFSQVDLSEDFDFFLSEAMKEESREWDEFSILLPRHGRFWDNGYEDVESKEEI